MRDVIKSKLEQITELWHDIDNKESYYLGEIVGLEEILRKKEVFIEILFYNKEKNFLIRYGEINGIHRLSYEKESRKRITFEDLNIYEIFDMYESLGDFLDVFFRTLESFEER